MSKPIHVGFYNLREVHDGAGKTWWTIEDRRTARPVAVDGRTLEFYKLDDAKQWAGHNSKAVRK